MAGRGLSHEKNEAIHQSFVCPRAPSHEQLMHRECFSPFRCKPSFSSPTFALFVSLRGGCHFNTDRPLPPVVTRSPFVHFVFSGCGLFFSLMASKGRFSRRSLWIFPLRPASFNVNWQQRLAADALQAFSDTPDALSKQCAACATKDSSTGLSSSLC